MYHNMFRYEYLTFQTQIHLYKQYIFDTNNIQSKYAFLFPFSIVTVVMVMYSNQLGIYETHITHNIKLVHTHLR